MRTRRSDETGSTVVELVVAGALLSVLLAMATQVVVTGHVAVNRSVAVSALHADSRSALTEAVRRLRSARPAGYCADPAGAPLSRCLRLGSRQATILLARADRVCFASFVSGSSAALRAPDLVCLQRVGNELHVTSLPPAADNRCPAADRLPVSYTTPCWDHTRPRRTSFVGTVTSTRPLFVYEDRAGRAVTAGPSDLDVASESLVLAPTCEGAATCAASELARIATVRVDVEVARQVQGRTLPYRLHTTVSPRGSRYADERSTPA